jgi:ABC-type Fe3+ transport system permease subunit
MIHQLELEITLHLNIINWFRYFPSLKPALHDSQNMVYLFTLSNISHPIFLGKENIDTLIVSAYGDHSVLLYES